MSSQNASINVTHFIIGGFDTLSRPIAVGVVILIIYLLAVLANMANIMFIISDKRLHKPMYLMICNLAVVDIVYTSSCSPTMIGVLLAGVNTVSYVECLIQMCAFTLGTSMESFVLAFMALDRFIAIIYPFQYHSYLTNTRVLILTFIMWFVNWLSSNNGKKEMGSTLVSHLICVILHYCPAFVHIIFTRFGVVLTLEERQGLVIGAVLGPCLVNPFVYCLRTKEIKQKLLKIFTHLTKIL
ncbi:LOW QUALITY PROTEIN: olfactory receptor 867-like [Oreochromis niloticus]|uniref:LOW QUALITY PROTEIN: olfactory receptor 867-like n=1 Tax=Oreochromis niloticus TaxID=8128 RepID=UPI00090484B0|nr:LOW QUALITY PROTEIN: olfactory receptor 867-like [Oreochromis niloticus]